MLRRAAHAPLVAVAALASLVGGPPASSAQFEVCGTISVSPGSVVDSDVNDPNAPYVANDNLAQSQRIPAPGALGGYLNNPGAGEDGRSKASGDVVDVFRSALLAGTEATLFIAEDDGAIHDLDLFLFDAGNPSTLVDSSLGTETTEQVEAPYGGEFYIVVLVTPDAARAATNYLLVIGQAPRRSPAFNLTLEDDFVDGQAIVRFGDAVPPAGGAAASALAVVRSLEGRASSIGLDSRGGAPGRNMLFERGRGGAGASAVTALGTPRARAALEACLPMDAALRNKLETLWMIKKLRRRSDVVGADPNYLRRTTATPNDEFYDLQWHFPMINLPQAWEITTGSPDTVVAVIDTGVLRAHPDLQGSLLQGPGSEYDFVSSTFASLDGDGIDPDWTDPGDGGGETRSSFHGTHVAGTIAAATDNRTGVAGVDWNARIMPVRALGRRGIGNAFDIQQAVLYAAGLPNDSGTVPPKRADIINLSLGGSGSSQLEQAIYTQARAAGAIVIAAAGNSGSSAPSYPAAYDGVVSVSAVDILKRRAVYSNFGSTIDVAAPGGEFPSDVNGDGYVDGVLSTWAEDLGVFEFRYGFYQGTSMAAPHVAGVVSLMKAVHPSLSPTDLDVLLAVGAITDDLGAPGRDAEYGNGLINAHKAVVVAGDPMPTPSPELAVAPNALNFGLGTTATTLTVSNAGGGSLTVTGVTEDSGGWLAVSAANVDASNLGTYIASVDRSGLLDGAYAATITFMSTAGSVDVRLIIQVGADIAGDAGFQYILLIDAGTLAPVAEIGAGGDGGNYDFAFTDVPGGTYYLAAGSDADNDFTLCEIGEACGGYPVLNDLDPITVDRNVGGLGFTSGFLTPLPEPSRAVLGLAALATLNGLALGTRGRSAVVGSRA